MFCSDEYKKLLGFILRAHVTPEERAKVDYFFALYDGKLSPTEIYDLTALVQAKFSALTPLV